MEGFPLILKLRFLVLVFLGDSGLNSLNFFVSILLSELYHFNEVVWFHNSPVWLNLDYVSTDELFVGDYVLGDNVTDINNAILIPIGKF